MLFETFGGVVLQVESDNQTAYSTLLQNAETVALVFPRQGIFSLSVILNQSLSQFMEFFSCSPNFSLIPNISFRKWIRKDGNSCDCTQSWRWGSAESAGWCSTYRDRNSRIHRWEMNKQTDFLHCIELIFYIKMRR